MCTCMYTHSFVSKQIYGPNIMFLPINLLFVISLLGAHILSKPIECLFSLTKHGVTEIKIPQLLPALLGLNFQTTQAHKQRSRFPWLIYWQVYIIETSASEQMFL